MKLEHYRNCFEKLQKSYYTAVEKILLMPFEFSNQTLWWTRKILIIFVFITQKHLCMLQVH